MSRAEMIGRLIARTLFEGRNNPPAASLTEQQVSMLCQLAAQTAMDDAVNPNAEDNAP